MWGFHCGRGVFKSLNRYTDALRMRYGKSNSLKDFAKKAQVLNYELMRPMFEAFSARRYTSTGIIQWMLNSAWPELYWQLYDSYLMPNGAYYGAKKANRPLHALYDYAKNAIFIVNDRLENSTPLKLKVRIFNIDSKVIFKKVIDAKIAANSSEEVFHLPDNLPVSNTFFLDLRLLDRSLAEIDNNFYWLSTQKDLLDYKAKVHPWYFYTPTKQYADYTQLNDLPQASVSYRWSQTKKENKTVFQVTLKNTGNKLAFFVHPAIIDQNTRETILPVIWSDNYISLLPHESQTLTAEIKLRYLKDKLPALRIEAYNPIKLTLLE
jgi:exo-1,4-beta-D-glucosaminidase